MTTPRPSHLRVVPASGAATAGPAAAPEPDISVRCHRRLRGPYSGGGALLRDHVVPELLDRAADLVAPRVIEIIALAPELAPWVPSPPWTLAEHADGPEPTRYHGAGRTRRLAHGIAELLMDWAKACRPDGVVIEFRDLDHADPTDLELIDILLRRCDPSWLTFVIDGVFADGDSGVGPARTAHTRTVADWWPPPRRAPGTDLAQVFIDSDGTDPDPAVRHAYAELPPEERARRHTARADELTARGEPSLLPGAVAYHVEHGTDPGGTGVETMDKAMIRCLHLGFYDAAMDLALRGRRLTTVDQPRYAAFTHRIGACLAYLDRGWEAIRYFTEQRSVDADPEVDLGAATMLSTLYTRHLPRPDHDEHDEALAAFDEVIARDPEYADYYVERAGLRRDAGWYEGAFEDYDRAVRLSPPFFEVYVNRADMLRELGDDEAALRDLDYALELEPDRIDPLVNRAEILLAQGETQRAAADIAHGLTVEPGNARLLSARRALVDAGDADSAYWGALPAGAGHADRAWASYAAAPREDADLAAWTNPAVRAHSLGRTAEAIDDLDHAIRLADDPVLRVNRAIALQELGDHPRALADLDAALAENGADDPELLYRRGASRHATGDITGARADWRAHLAAYGAARFSPHLDEIRRHEADLVFDVFDGPAWNVLAG
jgi:tetratricopeptide (TPR) repeat protein